jgi:hypothetical protein
MAAATIASTSRPHYEGDVKVFYRNYTSLADTNTDTWPAGTNIIGVNVIHCNSTATVNPDIAANVITYHVSAGTPNVNVAVLIGPA